MSSIKKTFPAVGGYAEALANPQGRFASLRGVRAVTDADGGPRYVCGTGRVTFRIEMDGEPYEMTCFTSAAACAAALGKYGDFLPDEIYVYGDEGQGDYYPVVLRPLVVSAAAAAHAALDVPQTENNEGELHEGLRVVVRGNRFGYADETGRIVIGPQYAWAGDFSEGRAMVAVEAPAGEEGLRMGLIDREGRAVIPPVYDDLSWDGSRYAVVDREGLHGCLDRTGRTVVPLEYDWVGEFGYGFAVVMREGRYGYVDETGTPAGEGLVYADARSVAEDGTAEVQRSEHDPWRRIRLF